MNYYIRITKISSSFKKITYLWHIRVAAAVSDINNNQHIKKLGDGTFLLLNIHPRSMFSWTDQF